LSRSAAASHDTGVKLNAIDKYPFERLTQDAKRTLVAAQEEAERMRVGYIGTEHILLGLLRVESGAAFRVLTRFDVSPARVREIVGNMRRERPRVEQVIPTSRVKRIIEISFLEATRLGHQSVDTGHLLLGVVKEGEGIAAIMLQDLGASAERVVAEVERELGARPSAQGKEEAHRPTPASLDLQIHALRDKLASIRLLLGHAVAARDTEHALKLGSEENRLESELRKAEREWLDSIS
jgi:ATP-dependent Clp protease ATP-binding subunit ClpC